MRVFCSICKDIFIPYSEVHVTNCGHLYHAMCISTWIEQHRTCPQCRTNLSKPFRVYFDVDKDNELDPSTLEHQVETLTDKLREAERQNKNLEEEKKNFELMAEGMKECAVSLNKKNDVLKTSVKALKEQVTRLSKQNEAVSQLQDEVLEWKNKASNLKRAEVLIKGSVDEVNKMIESTPVTSLAVKQLCTYVGILKTQLQKIETRNSALAKENKFLAKAAAEEKRKSSTESEEILNNLRKVNSELENELYCLKMLFKDYKKKHSDKKGLTVSHHTDATQMKIKQSSFDSVMEILDDNENNQLQSSVISFQSSVNENSQHSVESEKRINYWEELVCAGPSKNFNLSIKRGLSYSRSLNCSNNTNNDKDVSRSNSVYVFDGLGGRKKLRLGGPTPVEEFENIKKRKDQKSAPSFQHKKIIEYYQNKKTGNCVLHKNFQQ